MKQHEPMSVTEAAELRDRLHAEGKQLVFTSGCFDILHAGHVRYLRQARAEGHALCLAMNSDASVQQLKGPTRPINSEQDRAEVLLGLESVDAVVVFSEERTSTLIHAIRPHIFAKGGDYTPESVHPAEKAALDAVGAKIVILPQLKGRSTTATLKKLQITEKPKKRIAIMGSGAGSNFEALHDAILRGEVHAEIVLVLSDRVDAPILAKAAARKLEHHFIPPGDRPSRISPPGEKEIGDRITASGADLIVLAGFMRLLSPSFVGRFERKIINVHPSLLPKYPGKTAIQDALDNGELQAGCTVHWVDAGMDTGEIISQQVVQIDPGETEPTLRRKIQLAEHKLLPETINRQN
jgi:formyltetrahydrofolate-dependent phosphoribosylglycinamide formyltransferase